MSCRTLCLSEVTLDEWEALSKDARVRVLKALVSNSVRMLRAGLHNVDQRGANILLDLKTQQVTFIDFGFTRTVEESRAACEAKAVLACKKASNPLTPDRLVATYRGNMLMNVFRSPPSLFG